MKEKFAFVILHYCALQETMDCVSSIKKYVNIEEYLIVIVDNGSPNGTGKKLFEHFSNDLHCKVILNEENLGFAKGNNVGFRYAKEIGADFICMMNSDTCLMDDGFVTQVVNDYNKYQFYVLGPDIILRHPQHMVNPLGNHVYSAREAKGKILSLKFQIILAKLSLLGIARKIVNRGVKYKESRYDRNQYYQNVKLHGCCLIFSKDYINRFNGINENTFLYLEEDLLYLEMMHYGCSTLYSPNVKIFHSEDASTNYIIQGKGKMLFVLKNHLASMVVLWNRAKQFENS